MKDKMSKKTVIRELTTADATEEMAATLWAVATSGFGEDSPWTEEQLLRLLVGGQSIMLAATQAGEVVGLLVASETTVESDVYMVVVGADHKRQGIGKQLFHQLITYCTEKDLATIFLEVRESNLPAYNLYKSLGFEEIGRRRAYYSKPIEDALMMKIDLQREEQ